MAKTTKPAAKKGDISTRRGVPNAPWNSFASKKVVKKITKKA